MKNKIILSLLLVCVLAMPIFTKAITIDELKAQIANLQLRISQLITQLAQLQGNGATAWCHNFTANLGVGSRGEEVQNLLAALHRSDVWNGESGCQGDGHGPCITFDEGVASAVVAFQEKYKSEVLTPYGLKRGTGFVGKSTRAKLNKLYGCNNGIGNSGGEKVCTMDAKQCSGGSYVGRKGPNCEFAPCPCTDSDGSKDYYTKGTTFWGPISNVIYAYNATDVCDTAGKILSEMYCSNGNSVVEYYTCLNGCSNGACVALRPDLIVKDFTYRNIPASSTDTNAYFDITIQNIGQADVKFSPASNGNNFSIRVYKNSIDSDRKNVITGGIWFDNKVLKPGETYSFSTTAFPVYLSGEITIDLKDIKSIIVRVDDEDVISESNESNNTMSKTVN